MCWCNWFTGWPSLTTRGALWLHLNPHLCKLSLLLHAEAPLSEAAVRTITRVFRASRVLLSEAAWRSAGGRRSGANGRHAAHQLALQTGRRRQEMSRIFPYSGGLWVQTLMLFRTEAVLNNMRRFWTENISDRLEVDFMAFQPESLTLRRSFNRQNVTTFTLRLMDLLCL